MHVHDLQPFKWAEFNLSHTVVRLSFGKEYPGVINPLDAVSKLEGTILQFGHSVDILR